MSRFNQKPPEKRELRTLSGEIRFLQKANDYLYTVELELLNDKVTANGWRYENLERHRPLFAGKPILIAYTRSGTKTGDGHNFRMKRTADGQEYASFTDADSERIIGSLSVNQDDMRMENREGNKWIIGKGTIWTWYAREAVEKIASQGRMSVSIETLVTRNRMENGEEVEEEYTVLGVTILGDDVPPAVAGAEIRPLSQVNFGELQLRAASYMGETKEGLKPAEKTDKGVKTNMSNSKRMRQLKAMFADHEVICASEDGLNVALCSKKDGDIQVYSFTENEPDLVVDSRFQRANATVTVKVNDELKISAPMDECIHTLQEQLDEVTKKAEAAEAEVEKLNSSIKEMKDKEKAHHRQMAKEAIHAALNEINKVQEAKGEAQVDEKVCEDVEKDIDNDVYADCVNADGEWNGDERACAAVKAMCMDVIRKNSAETIAKNRARTVWNAYENLGGERQSDIMAAYNRLK